ncbi:hypothetical protein [Gudongella sp. DL1XJH-153]|uniref:hypothetical protein n=1 Tax=Gudongella sp. DL1XJH-153 TaxID=3409804 RepID=UPI003BB76265
MKTDNAKTDQLIYCSVSFSKDGYTYYYRTEDENIETGDKVVVTVGPDRIERVGVVEEIERFNPQDVPYPIEKTKFILRKWFKEVSEDSAESNVFVLCDKERHSTQIHVWGEVKDGCLKISGQDLGRAPEEFFGDNEYEYFYDFDSYNTERLFQLLSTEDRDGVDEFKRRFSGNFGIKALREFCEESRIKYRFFSF